MMIVMYDPLCARDDGAAGRPQGVVAINGDPVTSDADLFRTRAAIVDLLPR